MITIAMSEYPGGAYRLQPQGQPARLRRLRRGRRADRGGASPPYSVVLLDEIEKAHRTCWSCSSRCSTRAAWRMAKAARSTSATPSSSSPRTPAPTWSCRRATNRGRCRPSNTSTNCSSPSSTACSSRRSSGRTAVIPYYPLKDENLRKIVRLKLNKIGKRIKANHGAAFEYDDAVVDAIAARCTESTPRAQHRQHPDRHHPPGGLWARAGADGGRRRDRRHPSGSASPPTAFAYEVA